MKNIAIHTLLVTVFTAGICSSARGQEHEMASVAKTIGGGLASSSHGKVAIVDFTTLSGQSCEAGRYLAEQLMIELVSDRRLKVCDRAGITLIMSENRLTFENLAKPENSKTFRELTGIDTIVSGSLVVIDSNVVVTVKGIATESREIVSTAQIKISLTDELKRLLNPDAPSKGTSASTASQRAAIGPEHLGPLTAAISGLTTWTTQDGKGFDHHGVSCTLEVENPDTKHSVALAATQSVRGKNFPCSVPVATEYRGRLVDGKGVRCNIQEVTGVSAVAAFEQSPCVTQNNPGAIVDYIRRGRKWEGVDGDGVAWMGSFTVIGPGQKVRIVANCTADAAYTRLRAEDFTEPFHFNMEFVVGVIEANEEPHKCRSLQVSNISIDRTLPTNNESK